MSKFITPDLFEIKSTEKIIKEMGSLVRSEILAYSQYKNLELPIYKHSFGSEDPKAPSLGLYGGVHGLERIGSQVCLSLLNSFSELYRWDTILQNTLKNIRVYFVPVVNPIGVYRKTRCNPQGVDLMRNAPVESDHTTPFLLGGHRYSSRLPWFRGTPETKMEVESLALIDSFKKESLESKVSIAIDFHSGFGLHDQLWFPYSKTKKPFPDLSKFMAWTELMERTYPYHFYKIEPQSLNYTLSGDLWDYLYDLYKNKHQEKGTFLPITLEMGSWMWIKKNPVQFFSTHGAFNPIVAHRLRRTLRRHNTFFEFLIRSLSSPTLWSELNPTQNEFYLKKALERWYE